MVVVRAPALIAHPAAVVLNLRAASPVVVQACFVTALGAAIRFRVMNHLDGRLADW